MDTEVVLSLSLARLYGSHANFAGAPRHAVADGYSAVDAAFSALLRQAKLRQPRNHKQKLDLVKENFSKIFDAATIKTKNGTLHIPGTDWASLEDYYKDWLASRYDDFKMGSAVASSRVREALIVVNAAIRHVAADAGIAEEEFELRVATRAFGFDFSEVSLAVGNAHDQLFAEAEMAGEAGGSRLGTKMAAATNYCDLDVMAGDNITQGIIRDDPEIAREAARVYHAFVDLAERVQMKRLSVISDGKEPDKCSVGELNRAPDFMLSLKARYHGGTTAEMGVRWFGRITEAIAGSLKKLIPD